MDDYTIAFRGGSTCYPATRYGSTSRSWEPRLIGVIQAELDRLDILHKFFAVARQDELHSMPFTETDDRGPRVLDLGTGTGIWAIEMGK